ncbi:amino acid adenylation domain-containing protein [Brenneria izbisi]|uniref:Amino acid adenylation domain-containing protein n=1 Tax=Brenneria izbisi TaxID=2939450 RepID=A0AA41Y2C5_9GAMM|nr:amino acid adenylation domain-containing protein [Brenneria izbisi]MCV9878116.1 amino acid adenylation domain-containing protein [Brenneria izbisi]MCV9881320.1 amino acid adenylation domain-containing protein [Brenneria izbisi]
MFLNNDQKNSFGVIDCSNQLAIQLASNTSLITLFKQQKDFAPQAPAVIFEQEILTRENLWQQAESIARYVKDNFGYYDRCVGLFVDPSISLMCGAWGIMLSGNGYLPLSPEYPEERLRYMLEDSRTEAVFTQEHLRQQLEQLAPSSVHIFTEKDVEKYMAKSVISMAPQQDYTVSADTLAYVIYTSGSTGKPKGVMIEQRSLVNQMHWLACEYQLSTQTRILQKTPMSFDAAQWEILSPACGSTVIMAASGIYKDPPRLIEFIRRYQVTALQCVPTLLQAILDDDDVLNCVSLKQVFSGGEALHKRLAALCLETLPGCQLVNLYGPTECTINSSAWTISKDTLEKELDIISIGRPIYNTHYYILDNEMRPVAPGDIGELYIGGIGLARGYLHQPEMTQERFLPDPFQSENSQARMYKTGDLARWSEHGTVTYVGRTDNQIKLRGYRIELDEIRSAIEKHHWVRHAAVIVKNDPHTGYQNLISFVELNNKEAALMDQGNAESHHQSKANKAQVYMQLSNMGCRDDKEGEQVINLPGAQESVEQRAMAFGRKTYRHYEGGIVTERDLLEMLAEQPPSGDAVDLSALSLASLGALLRYFGRFTSEERILPKYTWSSPGALYATQLYVELAGIAGIESGIYYYHPLNHQLVLCAAVLADESPYFRCHFIGKKAAIEPIYKNNIQEVLNFEAGHMQGVLDYVLPRFGLSIVRQAYCPEVKSLLSVADEDYYLTSCCIDRYQTSSRPPVDILVQAMPKKVRGLAPGIYCYKNQQFQFISSEMVQKKHVIAINQKVYENASFGIALLSRGQTGWQKYVTLGRQMQHLMNNTRLIGLMASGYSSETGYDLPAAIVLKNILSEQPEASYFCIGGRITEEQKQSEGMKEDSVHMKGPAEILRDDLESFLPTFMLPNKILVLDKLPQMANGKIDIPRLAAHQIELAHKTIVPPRNALEQQIAEIWQDCLKQPQLSIDDNFFEVGGNSLIAVALMSRLNKKLNHHLPAQLIFTAPTIEKLAQHITDSSMNAADLSRLIPLQPRGRQTPVFCWPGLGGYCMNLRTLAVSFSSSRPFYGIQASGINPGEIIYPTIKEMAAQDIQLIKQKQPHGPYVLWGYSFGARVAFEAAWQLESAGEQVEALILIAPGSPKVRQQQAMLHTREASYTNPAYLTILFSVFMGDIQHPLLESCLQQVKTRDAFIDFIAQHHHALAHTQIARITDIVSQTFEFNYSFNELKNRRLQAPISVIKAHGDDYSFIESGVQFSVSPPNVASLLADHYQLLKESHINELLDAIAGKRRVSDMA